MSIELKLKVGPYENSYAVLERYRELKEKAMHVAENILEDPSDLNNAMELAETFKKMMEMIDDE